MRGAAMAQQGASNVRGAARRCEALRGAATCKAAAMAQQRASYDSSDGAATCEALRWRSNVRGAARRCEALRGAATCEAQRWRSNVRSDRQQRAQRWRSNVRSNVRARLVAMTQSYPQVIHISTACG